MTQATNPNAYLLMMSAKYGEQYGVGESLLQQMTKSELDFLFALRKEIDCCPECRICQGETVYIGTLGSSLIYRCRHCGIETFKRLEMPNEEPECPQCDGADNQPDPEGNYELECGACGWKFNNPNETQSTSTPEKN